RWTVFEAGIQSARDPRHTVGPQRRRADEAAAGHG
ncbi:MAG: polysulfide reductase, partial [Actinomycetota bacterium]|nr:polysulfide reductase [Actinomycetota bacterium]